VRRPLGGGADAARQGEKAPCGAPASNTGKSQETEDRSEEQEEATRPTQPDGEKATRDKRAKQGRRKRRSAREKPGKGERRDSQGLNGQAPPRRRGRSDGEGDARHGKGQRTGVAEVARDGENSGRKERRSPHEHTSAEEGTTAAELAGATAPEPRLAALRQRSGRRGKEARLHNEPAPETGSWNEQGAGGTARSLTRTKAGSVEGADENAAAHEARRAASDALSPVRRWQRKAT